MLLSVANYTNDHTLDLALLGCVGFVLVLFLIMTFFPEIHQKITQKMLGQE